MESLPGISVGGGPDCLAKCQASKDVLPGILVGCKGGCLAKCQASMKSLPGISVGGEGGCLAKCQASREDCLASWLAGGGRFLRNARQRPLLRSLTPPIRDFADLPSSAGSLPGPQHPGSRRTDLTEHFPRFSRFSRNPCRELPLSQCHQPDFPLPRPLAWGHLSLAVAGR